MLIRIEKCIFARLFRIEKCIFKGLFRIGGGNNNIYVTTIPSSRMQMEGYGIFYLENLARTFAGFAASREFYLREGDFSEFRVIFGWELRERFWIIQYPDGV